MADQMSVEERLEKLEKNKSLDQQRRERTEQLEKLKRIPIKYVEDDPSRIHKTKAQIVKDKKDKQNEEMEVRKILAERKKAKVEVKAEAPEPEEKKAVKKRSKKVV